MKGYDFISTDIARGDQYDFLTYEPAVPYECIITNPPYPNDMINAFLQRCHDLQKPFALLIPVMVLGSATRLQLLKQLDVELLFFIRHITFYSPRGKNTSFVPFWVCHRLLPERLMWV
jgi:hypothetical protein